MRGRTCCPVFQPVPRFQCTSFKRCCYDVAGDAALIGVVRSGITESDPVVSSSAACKLIAAALVVGFVIRALPVVRLFNELPCHARHIYFAVAIAHVHRRSALFAANDLKAQ